jgi:hypothetical protein
MWETTAENVPTLGEDIERVGYMHQLSFNLQVR